MLTRLDLGASKIQWPERPDLDLTETGHRVSGRDVDHIVETVALKHIKAGHPLFRFEKWAIRDAEFAVANLDRFGFAGWSQAVPNPMNPPALNLLDPVNDGPVVTGHFWCRHIGRDKKQVLHLCSPIELFTNTTNDNGVRRQFLSKLFASTKLTTLLSPAPENAPPDSSETPSPKIRHRNRSSNGLRWLVSVGWLCSCLLRFAGHERRLHRSGGRGGARVTRQTKAAEAVTEVAYAAFSAPFGTDGLPLVLALAQKLVGADIAGFYLCEQQGWTAHVYVTPVSVWPLLPFDLLPTSQPAAGYSGNRHLDVDSPTELFSVTDLVVDRTRLESETAQTMRVFWGRQYHFTIPLPWGVAPGGESHAWVFGRSGANLSAADRDLCDAIAPVLTAVAKHRVTSNLLHARLAIGDLLTHRELLVLRLQAQGVGARGIAAQLGMSPRTAQKHAEHIYRKLGVHSRQDAVRACKLLGISKPAASSAVGPERAF